MDSYRELPQRTGPSRPEAWRLCTEKTTIKAYKGTLIRTSSLESQEYDKTWTGIEGPGQVSSCDDRAIFLGFPVLGSTINSLEDTAKKSNLAMGA